MKKFKHSIPLILWFVILSKLAYSGLIIKINGKNWLINFCQLIAWLLIYIQSYALLEMLIKKKISLVVLKLIRIQKFKKQQRIFFLARFNGQQERILSKVSKNGKINDTVHLRGYYTFFNKLKIIDRYEIGCRLFQLAIGILVISILSLI
jgi:hypothetical protein